MINRCALLKKKKKQPKPAVKTLLIVINWLIIYIITKDWPFTDPHGEFSLCLFNFSDGDNQSVGSPWILLFKLAFFCDRKWGHFSPYPGSQVQMTTAPGRQAVGMLVRFLKPNSDVNLRELPFFLNIGHIWILVRCSSSVWAADSGPTGCLWTSRGPSYLNVQGDALCIFKSSWSVSPRQNVPPCSLWRLIGHTASFILLVILAISSSMATASAHHSQGKSSTREGREATKHSLFLSPVAVCHCTLTPESSLTSLSSLHTKNVSEMQLESAALCKHFGDFNSWKAHIPEYAGQDSSWSSHWE